MRVVLLAPTPPPAGGIAGWTARMTEAKLKDGWEVDVVDEKVTGTRQVFGKAGRARLFDELKRNHFIWSGLRKALKNPDAKVVHSCIPATTFAMMREYVCALITKNRKRRFIIHFRCTVPNMVRSTTGRFILKLLCRKSDMIFSLNNQTSRYLHDLTKTPVSLIPNFVLSNELAEVHKIKDGIETVLYVGGLVEDKGIYDVLEIARHFPDITFRLVGKGDEKFERYAKDEAIDNVIFAGAKDRQGVKQELVNADVFLFMTYFTGEGFSNALCEAMAAGLPCIATEWAANADMVGEDGGAVVPVGDIDAAIRALNTMKSYDIRKKQSEANIRKVSECYTDKVVLDMYVDAYEELLAINE